MPFTFGQLQEHCSGPLSAPQLVKFLLGDTWSLWFPEEGTGLAEGTILPRQSVLWLMHALDAMRQLYERAEASRLAAASSFAVLTETSKRRRATAKA